MKSYSFVWSTYTLFIRPINHELDFDACGSPLNLAFPIQTTEFARQSERVVRAGEVYFSLSTLYRYGKEWLHTETTLTRSLDFHARGSPLSLAFPIQNTEFAQQSERVVRAGEVHFT